MSKSKSKLLAFLLVAAISLFSSACGNAPTAEMPDKPVDAVASPVCSSSPERASPESHSADVETVPAAKLVFDSEGFERIAENQYERDGLLWVTLEVREIDEYASDEDSVMARIDELEDGAPYGAEIEQSEEISARITFPAWDIFYYTGENEDTNSCNDLYFQSDAHEYRVHVVVDGDHSSEYADVIGDIMASVQVVDA